MTQFALITATETVEESEEVVEVEGGVEGGGVGPYDDEEERSYWITRFP